MILLPEDRALAATHIVDTAVCRMVERGETPYTVQGLKKKLNEWSSTHYAPKGRLELLRLSKKRRRKSRAVYFAWKLDGWRAIILIEDRVAAIVKLLSHNDYMRILRRGYV